MVSRAEIDSLIGDMSDAEVSGSKECDCGDCRRLKAAFTVRLLNLLLRVRAEELRE